MNFFSSIKGKIGLFLVFSLLVSMLCVFLSGKYFFTQAFYEEMENNMLASQNSLNAYIKTLSAIHEESARHFANSENILQALANGETATLDKLVKAYIQATQADFLTLTDAKGNVISRGHSDKKGDSISNQTTVQLALQGKNSVGIIRGNIEPLTIRAGAPLYFKGELIGTVGTGESLISEKFVDTIKGLTNLETSVFVNDKRAMTSVKNKQGERVLGYPIDHNISEIVLKQGQTFLGDIEVLGSHTKSLYWPIKDNGDKIIGMWFLGKPLTQSIATLNKASSISLYIMIALTIVFASLGILMLMLYLKPIASGLKFASTVEAGDFNARWNNNSNDELGKLAKSLNRAFDIVLSKVFWYEEILNSLPFLLATMDTERKFTFANSNVCKMLNKKLSDLIGQPCYTWGAPICKTNNCAIERCLRKEGEVEFMQPGTGYFKALALPLLDKDGKTQGYIDMLFDINKEKSLAKEADEALGKARLETVASLEDVIENVSSSSAQLSTQILQSEKGAERTAVRMSETSTAMEEMNATVIEVARNAGDAASSTENMRQRAREGQKIMEQVVNGIAHLRQSATGLKTDMEELDRQADGISNIMTTISDIADQTNLLALNAAIEAARAGDAGRGFAVVADEVRKLAEKTQHATGEVGRAITQIQGSTRKNMENVDGAVEAIAKTTTLTSESDQSLNDIVTLSEEASDKVRAIATAAEEQSASSEEINRAIEQVNLIAGELSKTMSEASKAVTETVKQTHVLNGLIENMKKS